MTLDINERLAFSAQTPDGLDFSQFEHRVGTGFNQYGVRENRDADGELESVDVIYEAMEPGPPERRNGVRITEGFLKRVAEKDYDQPPHLKDHEDKDTFSRIGHVRDVWFSDAIGKLMVMTRTPNVEGSRNYQEAIARYTHEPPAIRDGSLGFGRNYEVVRNDSGEPQMKNGKFREFSAVNFPGGYDEGGINTAFAEAISEFSGHDSDGESYSYDFRAGDWVQRDWSDGEVYGKVRDRTKDSFTVNGNTISGEDGEPVYKFEEYDTDSGEFTGQMIAAPQSGLESWDGPQDMSEEEAYLSLTFDSHDDELDEVYSEWSDHVNMTASQLERWADHPCSDTASLDPEAVRKRNLRLLEKNKSEWTSDDIEDAKRTISFISRMRGQKPDEPASGGKGTCPSEWAVSLLNWAYNPFDGMPDGEPNPDAEENAVSVETVEFDDPSVNGDGGENSAADVRTEEIQF